MKKTAAMILLCAMLFACAPICASAAEFTAPTVTGNAQIYMPENQNSFGRDLLKIIGSALRNLRPDITDALRACISLIAAVILISVLHTFTGNSKKLTELVGTIIVAAILTGPANALIRLGVSTVSQISNYGMLLLPTLTAALAAQGGVTRSAALYAGTAAFDAVLTGVINKMVVPLIYIFLSISIADRAIDSEALANLKKLIKWFMTWCLKIIIYVFTGYISITGVVSGTVDASALKVTKLAISGSVPVVGGLISDASETILVSAGIMKNSAGIYGVFAVIAILIEPFCRIGIQYLILKATAAICGIFGEKRTCGMIEDFSGAMGTLLAMTGIVSLLFLISVVCFMKGVSA